MDYTHFNKWSGFLGSAYTFINVSILMRCALSLVRGKTASKYEDFKTEPLQFLLLNSGCFQQSILRVIFCLFLDIII